MDWNDIASPSLVDFEALARRAFGALPSEFRALTGDIRFVVDDFPAEDVLREMGCGVPAGAPGRGGQDGVPVAFHRPDLAAGVLDLQAGVVEDLAEELANEGSINPGCPEPGADFGGRQVGGEYFGEFLGVDREAGVLGGGFSCGLQLVADIAVPES